MRYIPSYRSSAAGVLYNRYWNSNFLVIIVFGLFTVAESNAAISKIDVQTFQYTNPEILFSASDVSDGNGVFPIITQQFNQYHGDVSTLLSYTITWDLRFSATGTLADIEGGFIQFWGTGYNWVNDVLYNGMGFGTGEGMSAGDTLQLFQTLNLTQTFYPDSITDPRPSLLANIVGSGTFDLTWGESTLGEYSFGAGSTGIFDSISYQIDAGSSYSVIYESVPEPSSFAFSAIGIICGYALRRRRRL
ncbi:MAG: hypothetical protein ACJAS1_004421 [Oleiphilaceae bacterium]|jgi:hypothetical protein